MHKYNSYDLFVKNPLAHTNFPFLALDCNNQVSIPPRQRFQEMHWHDDIQITYVLSGQIKVISMNQSLVVKQGEAVFINKHVLHQFVEIEPSHYRSFVFSDIFVKFYEDSPMSQMIESLNETKHIGIYFIHHFHDCMIYIQKLDDCIFGTFYPHNKEYYITMCLVELIYTFLSALVYQKTADFIVSDYHLGIQKCLAFIHRHYQEDISLEDIAYYGDMSAGHCGRLFLQVLEPSPYEYLINYRIKKSLELLSHNNQIISRIAIEVGFNDVSHFIQSFKKRMNVTPKQYQKQLFKVGNDKNHFDI